MKVSKQLAKQILKSNKEFILYNLDINNNILDYRFSNNIVDKNNNRIYNKFKVLSCIKNELLTINIQL